jgi:hypothetical protein
VVGDYYLAENMGGLELEDIDLDRPSLDVAPN